MCVTFIAFHHGQEEIVYQLKRKSKEITDYDKSQGSILDNLDALTIETMKDIIREEHNVERKSMQKCLKNMRV
jgi:hypothetical protein